MFRDGISKKKYGGFVMKFIWAIKLGYNFTYKWFFHETKISTYFPKTSLYFQSLKLFHSHCSAYGPDCIRLSGALTFIGQAQTNQDYGNWFLTNV